MNWNEYLNENEAEEMRIIDFKIGILDKIIYILLAVDVVVLFWRNL